jgi:hypothetical protein
MTWVNARRSPVDASAGVLRLDTAPITPGRHTVRVTVHDPTPFVRHDPAEALVERFEWIVEITP